MITPAASSHDPLRAPARAAVSATQGGRGGERHFLHVSLLSRPPDRHRPLDRIEHPYCRRCLCARETLLNVLLIASPLNTFFMRVRGQRLRDWGVRDGDRLLIDRAIDPRPGHLVVVACGERFLLRLLVTEGEQCHLEPLDSAEVPILLDRHDLVGSGLCGVAVGASHHLLRRQGLPRDRSQRPLS